MNKNARDFGLVGILGLIVAIAVAIFGDNWYERVTKNEELPDIVGIWNPKKAEAIIYSLMREYENNNKFDVGCIEESCITFNKVIDHYWIDMGENQAFISIAYTGLQDSFSGCHSCPAPLSIFEFEKVENGYNLTSKYYNYSTLGKYGLPPEKINIINIGYNKFGLEIIDEFDWSGAEGIFTENRDIYCQIGDSLKKVLELVESKYYIEEGYPNHGKDEYTSEIKIIKDGTGYYDIEITKEGVMAGKPFTNKITYIFDGINYSEK